MTIPLRPLPEVLRYFIRLTHQQYHSLEINFPVLIFICLRYETNQFLVFFAIYLDRHLVVKSY